MAEFKRESWVEKGCDVIQSRHQNKRGGFSMQKRSARFMFYPSLGVLSTIVLEKIVPSLCFLDSMTSQKDG